MNNQKSLAILGAGKLGIVLAQLATNAGYQVYIAGSTKAEKIKLTVSVLAPKANPVDATEAIKRSDIVILALPLGKYRNLPKDLLAGKLVVDAMDYWWEVDGEHSEFANPETSTSELVQSYLNKSRIVKAFSHMGYHHLYDEAMPKASADRKAIAVAGDTTEDTHIVAAIVDDLGFDPVLIGTLHEGRNLEPGHQAFGANVDSETLKMYVSKK